MHRRVIYQSLAYAVPIIAAVVTTGELVAATRASSYQPPQKRVIQQPLAWSAPVVAPTAGNADRAFAASSHQLINRSVVFEDATTYVQAVLGEIITADKWHQQLALPVRKPRLVDRQALATFPIQPQVNVAWWSELARPIRLRRQVIEWSANAPYIAPPPAETVTVDKWYAPLAAPVLRERTAQIDYAQTPYIAPVPGEPGDADLAFAVSGWQVINRSIIYEPGSSYAETPAPVAETVTVDKWYRQLDLPVRRKALPAGGYQFEARAAFPQVPWGWYEKLDEPTRLKKTPTAQLAYTFVAAAPGAGTAYNWFTQLDVPTRARRLYELPYRAVPVYFVQVTPGPGVAYDWFQQLDEPLRIKRSLYTQQLGSYANYTPPPAQPGDATLCFGTFSNQVLHRSVIFEDRTTYGEPPAAVPETVTIDKWFAPLNERVRPRRFVAAQYQSSFVFLPTVTIDRWWRELVRPTRRTKPVPQQMGYTFVAAAPGRGVAYNWFTQLDTPTRRDPRRIAVQQGYAFLATGLRFPQNVSITVTITVEFARMLRYSCKAEQADGYVEEAEQSDPWTTASEVAVSFADEIEQSDPWSTEDEQADASDEEEPNPQSGCE